MLDLFMVYFEYKAGGYAHIVKKIKFDEKQNNNTHEVTIDFATVDLKYKFLNGKHRLFWTINTPDDSNEFAVEVRVQNKKFGNHFFTVNSSIQKSFDIPYFPQDKELKDCFISVRVYERDKAKNIEGKKSYIHCQSGLIASNFLEL